MLALSSAVKSDIESLSRAMPQALLLSGKAGTGLMTIARELASSHETIEIVPQFLNKTSSTRQISVAQVRELYDMTKSRSAGVRVVIIDDIDAMTHQAQNAFLKLLEEPNDSTNFILTTHHLESVLPTVRSRARLQTIPLLSASETVEFTKTLNLPDEKMKSQLLFMASGLPAEMTRLASDPVFFEKSAARVVMARHILESSTYERLKSIMANPLDRTDAVLLTDQLIRLLTLKPTAQNIRRVEKLMTSRERILMNGNVKLQLASGVI